VIEPTTILLVEDDPLTALSETRQLEREGYRIIGVSNGEAAIMTATEHAEEIDLVLMDINLGEGVDGTQAAREILARHDFPILFLSSHTEKEIVEKTEKITNYGYVVKNSSFTVLDASIKMALKLYDAHRKIDRINRNFEAANEELRASLESLGRASERLALSEEKFSKAFHLSPDAVSLNRLSDGVYIDVNRGFTHLTGYTREEVIGRSALPEDLGVWGRSEDRERLVEGLREAGEVVNLEAQFRRKDGGVLTGLMSAHVIDIEGDRCLISITKDISGLKSLENNLNETEQKFRLAFENSPIGISLTDLDGRLRMVNHAFCDMLGRTMAEVNAMDYVALTHADDRETSKDVSSMLLSGVASTRQFRKRYIHEDGHPVWADVNIALVRDAEGNPDFFISHVIDITGRKRQEEELGETKNRYFDLLNSIGEGFCYVDADEIFRMANPACERVLGVGPGELLGRPFFPFLDGEGRSILDAENAKRARGESSEYLLPIVRADGMKRILRVNAAPLGKKVGDYIGASVIFRDVTEELQASDDLNRLVRNKEILMQELQHRVKNSLSIVSSLLSIAKDELTEQRAIDVLEDTRSRINSMSAIYERLYLTESVETIDFGDYLGGLAKSIFSAFFADQTRVRLVVVAASLKLDTKRAIALGLIVNELFTNSAKYAFPGGRSGTIRVLLQTDGSTARLTVSDDGVGIDPQLPKASMTMGMTLIRLLVAKELEGTLNVDAERGTSMTVVFRPR